VDLARGRMAEDVLAAVRSERVPVRIVEEWRFSRRDNVEARHWLPLVLPLYADRHPRPFVYLVDSFTDLAENRYWFALRRSVVDQELVIDLCGNVLSTSVIA
jgi:hypothetical protein